MVYVDNVRVPFKGRLWCHLLADDLNELHAFAVAMNIDPRLFHRKASYPHYDITIEMREVMLQHGAIPADRKTIIECAKKLKLQLLNLERHEQS
jgi:hypothetical protein